MFITTGGRDGMAQPPMEQYRKRIGRQDSKKEKQHLKAVKHQQQAKENRLEDYKDSALILLAVLAVFGTVYLVLFFAVRKSPT